jgi:hypothetical protein
MCYLIGLVDDRANVRGNDTVSISDNSPELA